MKRNSNKINILSTLYAIPDEINQMNTYIQLFSVDGSVSSVTGTQTHKIKFNARKNKLTQKQNNTKSIVEKSTQGIFDVLFQQFFFVLNSIPILGSMHCNC